MEITTGAIVIALMGGGILVALGLETRKTRSTWLEGVLKNVEDRMNEVVVEPLTQAQAVSFLNQHHGGGFSDWREVAERITYGNDSPLSNIVMFKIHSDRNARDVTWYMNVDTNEFYVKYFRIGDSHEKQLAFDYRLRLKEVGNQAYVMWKMGNF